MQVSQVWHYSAGDCESEEVHRAHQPLQALIDACEIKLVRVNPVVESALRAVVNAELPPILKLVVTNILAIAVAGPLACIFAEAFVLWNFLEKRKSINNLSARHEAKADDLVDIDVEAGEATCSLETLVVCEDQFWSVPIGWRLLFNLVYLP